MRKNILSFLAILFFASVLNAQNILSEPDSCLIAKYYFNSGNVNDDYVGGYNGKQVGATLATDRFGNANAAWNLAGTQNSYLNLGTYSALKPADCSISMWFKITAPTYLGSGYTYNPLMLTKCQAGNNCYEAYCLYYDFTTQKIGGANTQLYCNQPCVWSSTVSLSSWHHIVLTYDTAVITLYLDAVSQGTITKGFSQVYLASDSVMIGNSANVANDRYFHGAVDDIRFYHCVIPQYVVTNLYNEPNWFVPTGINSLNNNSQISIFPNPTTNDITVSLNKINENSVAEIYNTLGQIIKREPLTNLQTKINLCEHANGIYFVKVIENGNTVYYSKIIKQ